MLNLFEKPEHIPATPPQIRFDAQRVSASAVVLSSDEAALFQRPLPHRVAEVAARHGSRLAFSRSGFLTYLLTSPKAVNQVLVEQADAFLKGEQERTMSGVIGWGLIVEEGATHRRQQRAISPSLRGEVLGQYAKTVVETAREFVAQHARPELLVDWTRRFSQASAEKALFPVDGEGPDFRYQHDLLLLNETAMWGPSPNLTPGEALDWVRSFRQRAAFVNAYVDRLTRSWTQTSGDGVTLMDVIMGNPEARSPGEQGIHAQVALFLQASVETTASLVSWMILALARAPHYWTELHREARLFSSSGSSYRELSALPWHQAIVNESLRLYPPAWMFPRTVSREVEVDGVNLEVGTQVLLSPWVTQRKEQFFERPGTFWPERWLIEGWSPSTGSYFPFGRGLRVCTGERYAKLTATILLNYLAGRGLTALLSSHDDTPVLASLISGPSPDISFQVV